MFILKLLKIYLGNPQQSVNINNHFSFWETTSKGVPQSYSLDSLSFKLFLNDFFLSVVNSHLSNYADDNTLYCCSKRKNEMKDKLKSDFLLVTTWFHKSRKFVNLDKCH